MTTFYKSIFLILLTLPLLSVSQEKNDLTKMELRGKVQKMRTFICNIDTTVGYNEATATFYVDKHFVFNENGNIAENFEYNQETNVAEIKEVIEYDSLNRKTRSITRNLDTPDQSPSIIDYRYNENGLLYETYSENMYSEIRTNSYYDEKNNLVKTVANTGQGKSEIYWKYNSKNQEIEEFMPDNYIITTTYDSLDRIASITVEYLSEKSKDQVFYIYNEKNLEIENKIIIIENEIKSEFTIKIDYLFDNQNNWIQKSKSIDNKIVELVKRSIVYFP